MKKKAAKSRKRRKRNPCVVCQRRDSDILRLAESAREKIVSLEVELQRLRSNYDTLAKDRIRLLGSGEIEAMSKAANDLRVRVATAQHILGIPTRPSDQE